MWNVLFSLLFIAWLALPDSVNLRLCICWRSLGPRSKLGNCGIFAQTSFVLNVSGSMMSSQAMTWINHNWQWTGLNYVIAWPLREYADTHRDKISNINAWLLKSAKREIETWLNCANFIQWHCQVLNVDNGFFEHVIVEIMVHQRQLSYNLSLGFDQNADQRFGGCQSYGHSSGSGILVQIVVRLQMGSLCCQSDTAVSCLSLLLDLVAVIDEIIVNCCQMNDFRFQSVVWR